MTTARGSSPGQRGGTEVIECVFNAVGPVGGAQGALDPSPPRTNCAWGGVRGGLIPFNALKFNKSFFDGKPVLSDSGGRTGAIPTLDNFFQPVAPPGSHANQPTTRPQSCYIVSPLTAPIFLHCKKKLRFHPLSTHRAVGCAHAEGDELAHSITSYRHIHEHVCQFLAPLDHIFMVRQPHKPLDHPSTTPTQYTVK